MEWEERKGKGRQPSKGGKSKEKMEGNKMKTWKEGKMEIVLEGRNEGIGRKGREMKEK